MHSGLLSVDIYLSLLKHSVKVERQNAFQLFLVNFEILAIPSVTFIEVGRQEIWNAKRMGQTDVLPVRVIKIGMFGAGDIARLITPVAVEIINHSRCTAIK